MVALRLIQFTDPHLYADPAEALRGVPTLPSLQRALAHAAPELPHIDAVLVTGDVVQDDAGGYAHFVAAFSALGKPVYCLPGNHDEPDALAAACAAASFQYCGHADLGGWRLVLLDSVIPESAAGRLSPAALRSLESALAGAGTRPSLVCLHHHPISMGSRWLDQVGLQNAQEFFAVLDRHPQVRAVIWGHVHQPYEGSRNGVALYATPATCAQFEPGSAEFAVDNRPPAYRLLELHPDGRLETQLRWVED